MGSEASRDLNVVNSVVAESISKSMINVSNSRTTVLNQAQIMDIECSPSQAVELASIQAFSLCVKYNNPKKCESIRYACNIEDLTQDAMLEYRGLSNIDANVVAQIQASVSADLKNKANDSSDEFGAFLKKLAMVGSNESSDQNVSNFIENKVQNVVNVDLVNQINTTLNGNQTMTLKGTGLNAKRLTQKTAQRLVEDILAKTATASDLVTQVQAKTETETKKESKGLTDVVSSVTSMMSTLGLGWIIGLVVLVLGIGIVAYFLFSNATFGENLQKGVNAYKSI
jgi:hypothetical protein